MTRLFLVRAPITGWVEMFVEADTEDEAIDYASENLEIKHVTEWEEDLSRAQVFDETPDEVLA